ncbi:hypothetical protein CASFOL_011185 [Castilleja foliolosa]|uniref:Peptidase A1 domain-containing protein n=1 Tax=Castilleja foliolosa TaxID=1961234 RepID=A0ABD3DUR5_9LAMI
MHQEMYVKAFSLYLWTRITAVYGAYYLPLSGNVYPAGHYTVTMEIGNPPKPFVLDVILLGFSVFNNPYDFRNEAVISCADSACISLGGLRDHYTDICESSDVPCQYSFNYADGSLSQGILIRDTFPLTYNGETIYPTLSFGCGDPIQYAHSSHGHDAPIDGVLGLGKGESGILKQLSNMGVTRNVVGHCLSGHGGGYISFNEVPASIVWKHTLNNDGPYYNLGIAKILFGRRTTNIRRYTTIFDSGSTYTYLASKAYWTIFDLVSLKINNNLNGRLSVAVGDDTLPVCWQDVRPIETISQVDSYFVPLTLSFVDEKVGFEIPPQNYLIISEKNNVCLGIMENPEYELRDIHLIGDISMQDKLVIYDNDNGRVGWATVPTCNIFDQ